MDDRQPERLRVFISYSRRDTDSIDQLVAALEAAGFDPQIDRHGTAAGEAWQSRLREMIAQADTVIFALTPDAAASAVCEWEVDEARHLGKRLIPIVVKPLGGVAVSDKLSRLDYTFFYAEPAMPGSGFGQGLRKLVAALRVDVEWLREGTRLGELARHWQAGGEAENRLLSGADIAHATEWLAKTPHDAPQTPQVVRRFIRASEAHETQRQAREAARLATEETQAARLREAELASANARMNTADLRRTAQYTESGLLSRAAAALLDSDPVSAMLLALEGMPDPARGIDRPWVRETHVVLDQAVRLARELLVAPHPGIPFEIAISPDGRFIATRFEKLRLIEVATGREVALADDPGIGAFAFCGDGRLIGAVPGNMAIRIVEARTGEELASCVLHMAMPDHARVVFGHDGAFFAAMAGEDIVIIEIATRRQLARFEVDPRSSMPVLSPDRRFVATRRTDGKAEIRRIDDGGLQAQFAIEGRIAAFSPDGQFLATSSGGGAVRLHASDNGAVVAQLAYDEGIAEIAFSPDGRALAVATLDGALRLVDIASGRTLNRYACPRPGCLAFSSGGRFVAAGCGDDTARVFDTAPGPLAQYTLGQPVKALAFSPDGKRGAAASETVALLFDMASQAEVARIGPETDPKQMPDALHTVAFNADGRILGVGGRTPRLYEAQTGQFLRRLGVRGFIDVMAFSRDGTLVAMPGRQQPRLVMVETGEEREMPQQDGNVTRVAFSPDGRVLATGADDGTVVLYDVATLEERVRLRQLHPVSALAFSPDGQTLAMGVSQGRAWLIDVATVSPRAEMAHRGRVHALAFSPDSRVLATADDAHEAHLFSVSKGEAFAQLRHDAWVNALTISPDGRLAATASGDGMVRLFETMDGTEMARLAHSSLAVAFNRDGTIFGSGGADGTVRLWRVHADVRALVAAAKASATRGLTPEQRRDYFLPPTPPAWYVEQRLWPYHTVAWQVWLADKKSGGNPQLPTS